MKKGYSFVCIILSLSLLFNSFNMVYAKPNRIETPSFGIISSDSTSGSHTCEYQHKEHIVTHAEALRSNVAVEMFYGLVGLALPTTWISAVGYAIVGKISTFTPLAGDKVSETMVTTYDFYKKEYRFTYYEYVYRPQLGGGTKLVYQYKFQHTYPRYSNVYSIYKQNCPH